jgi:hypothetical protein
VWWGLAFLFYSKRSRLLFGDGFDIFGVLQ